VRGEAREAADRGILVPVRFEEARLPMDVRALHTTDLDHWGEDPRSPPFQEVLRALGAMIARAGASQTAKSAAGSAPVATAPKTPRASICVLPFSNMSGDAEQEYFSDGTARTSSPTSARSLARRRLAQHGFGFKGKSVDIAQIGRQLKVAYVLKAACKAAGRVRITAQLIEVSNDNHVWAERYDRDLNDIFAPRTRSPGHRQGAQAEAPARGEKAIEQRGRRTSRPTTST
jgi:adenylate cyclase